jgi:methyl-accepting chemotaxis protein
MDEMTQQNAAVVEQATAASQSMSEQASSLNRMLDKYQLGDADNAAPTDLSVDRVGLGAAA